MMRRSTGVCSCFSSIFLAIIFLGAAVSLLVLACCVDESDQLIMLNPSLLLGPRTGVLLGVWEEFTSGPCGSMVSEAVGSKIYERLGGFRVCRPQNKKLLLEST